MKNTPLKGYLLAIGLATLVLMTACSAPTPAQSTSTPVQGAKTYRTIMSGKSVRLDSIQIQGGAEKPTIILKLNDDGTKTFADYTSKHIGEYVTIALNKKVLMSVKILSAIERGDILIEGQSTKEEAQKIVEEIRTNPERLEFVETGNERLPIGEVIQTSG